MAYSCQVKITYYDEGYFKTVTGFIHVYEQLNKVIKLEKTRRFISLNKDIIDIQ
jgi:YolD-like protein